MNNSIYAKVICDSVSPLGVRLSSVEVQFPRSVLPQLLMTRLWSRSCESLRARPVKSKLEEVRNSPFVPLIRKNQKGMQPAGLLEHNQATVADHLIREHHQRTCELVEKLADLNVAKEIANRYLEAFAYQKVLITGTDFQNFFRLRCHEAAQDEIEELAVKMREALSSSEPVKRPHHAPYVSDSERYNWSYSREKLQRVCMARCARISYLNHEGRCDVDKDLDLAVRLIAEGHSNPAEHCCVAGHANQRFANLLGWVSFRFELEQNGKLPKAEG